MEGKMLFYVVSLKGAQFDAPRLEKILGGNEDGVNVGFIYYTYQDAFAALGAMAPEVRGYFEVVPLLASLSKGIGRGEQ